jgi:thioredoxin 1
LAAPFIHEKFKKKIMGKAIEITDSNFEKIIAGDQPVLIDFWADWCAPCKMIGPIVEELAGDFEGKAIVGKLDVQENSQVPAKFGIRNIPTLLVFKNGQLVDKQVGVVPKNVLAQKLNNAISTAAV